MISKLFQESRQGSVYLILLKGVIKEHGMIVLDKKICFWGRKVDRLVQGKIENQSKGTICKYHEDGSRPIKAKSTCLYKESEEHILSVCASKQGTVFLIYVRWSLSVGLR